MSQPSPPETFGAKSGRVQSVSPHPLMQIIGGTSLSSLPRKLEGIIIIIIINFMQQWVIIFMDAAC